MRTLVDNPLINNLDFDCVLLHVAAINACMKTFMCIAASVTCQYATTSSSIMISLLFTAVCISHLVAR